ncbi:arginine--tRNA ligase [Psychroflexus salis]|uniref:Arginine--tRNA ligase n=1 Tax=Psychroflexus salis TaxID=1526574 RepID=A0A917EAY1_9FLAO|nr:arginine--tRNA ligase [Psychroflexus salis]GGE20158.1 arginine--tRNA ligase [Psychroflexus salis]
MQIQKKLASAVTTFLQQEHQLHLNEFDFQSTRKEFDGDITLVVFSLLRHIKTNPVALGNAIGTFLKNEVEEVTDFNVVKGFLNISLSDAYFLSELHTITESKNFGFSIEASEKIMVEYSSPNTNKPLHLGHIRNNLLGYAVAEILKASGKKVIKTQIINDRGIHICKSMLAWQKFGNEENPESTGLKGDKLVGNYYVKFDKEYKKQIEALQAEGLEEKEAKKRAPLLIEAKQMLQKWEQGDEEVVALWKKMNNWVYEGFKETYKNLGVDFDKNYYESETYLLGKDIVAKGLEIGVFFKKEDGSVWIDLTEDGLDEKIVLRADGTAVYMTQDIGTAIQRMQDFAANGMVYTVGNEQDYHFKVLFLILKKLDFAWAENLYHLSYGMVDLPSGKMKSREGTVVDADDLIFEMTETARKISSELGKLDAYNEAEKEELYQKIGLGALKYYILKVDPKKRILFNPEESVDFQGNTGPFIQYTYARIQSILKKAPKSIAVEAYIFHEKEKALIKQLQLYPETIQQAASQYSPALIANYTYDLVKEFNSFYQNVSILGADKTEQIHVRVELSALVANVIKSAFALLGIEVPEQM